MNEGRLDWAGLLARTDRPAIRYGRWLVFTGGHTRRMGLVEYALVWLRLKDTVRR